MKRFLNRWTAVIGISAALAGPAALAQQPEVSDDDARMAWWREARFGMFIHWGLYSVLGGEWQGFDYGKEMGGASAEWILTSAGIPRDEYAALAKRFNPVRFDAAQWVGLAKQAGMKYMVITAKHHEGFSMFGSEFTDYDILDATPFKRDVIKELAEECEKQGLRFGVYYSHSRDWHNRSNLPRDVDPPPPEYVDFVEGQLRELLANYGDIGVLWFDTGDKFTEINSQFGRLVRTLSPDTIIGSRLNGDPSLHDFRTMADRSIPEGRVDFDAESPMTIRDNWGYDRDDDNWKSVEEILQRLSLTVCRGANLLLNVGPSPEGLISPEETERLQAVGRWMDVHGEAIYGTTAGPFAFDFEWGAISQKPGTLYLHVLKWNPDGIRFHGLKSEVKNAYLLSDTSRTPLEVEQDGATASVKISVPPTKPGEIVSVIVLEMKGEVEIDPNAEGTRHWNVGTGIRLNTEKIEKQRAMGRTDKREEWLKKQRKPRP